MPAKDVLETATKLVGGSRAASHGSMLETHENIAQLWNGYLYRMDFEDGDRLKASDVANMMELLKVARRKQGVFNSDDYIDGAGYAAVAFECAEEETLYEDHDDEVPEQVCLFQLDEIKK